MSWVDRRNTNCNQTPSYHFTSDQHQPKTPTLFIFHLGLAAKLLRNNKKGGNHRIVTQSAFQGAMGNIRMPF